MKSFNAGKYINQGTYKSFQPEYINKQWIIDSMELLNLLSQADRQLVSRHACSDSPSVVL